jgi:ketosteroid isomerase-like protein
MSQENVEIFRRAQEAYNEGDWDAVLATMDPNVVFDSTRAGPDGEVYRGHEGAKRFWRMLRDVFGSLRNEPEEIIDNGDRLFTRIRQRSTGRASGAMTEDVIYQIITLNEGKAIRVVFFRERAEALEAAGLSEQDAHADS